MLMYMANLCFCQIYRDISVKPPPGKSRNLKKYRYKYVILSACNSEAGKK